MFACALYPVDEPFLSSISTEVREQVSRLAHHPSIVIFGGNNENEVALRWYTESRASRDLYVVDYQRLYVETVLPAIAAADAEGRPTVDTSPGDGLLANVPYSKRWVGSASRDVQGASGDVHYYNYQVRPPPKSRPAHSPNDAGVSQSLLPERLCPMPPTQSLLPERDSARCPQGVDMTLWALRRRRVCVTWLPV